MPLETKNPPNTYARSNTKPNQPSPTIIPQGLSKMGRPEPSNSTATNPCLRFRIQGQGSRVLSKSVNACMQPSSRHQVPNALFKACLSEHGLCSTVQGWGFGARIKRILRKVKGKKKRICRLWDLKTSGLLTIGSPSKP